MHSAYSQIIMRNCWNCCANCERYYYQQNDHRSGWLWRFSMVTQILHFVQRVSKNCILFILIIIALGEAINCNLWKSGVSYGKHGNGENEENNVTVNLGNYCDCAMLRVPCKRMPMQMVQVSRRTSGGFDREELILLVLQNESPIIAEKSWKLPLNSCFSQETTTTAAPSCLLHFPTRKGLAMKCYGE